eukprot:5941748-Prymnesium_polylepis.1
MRSERVAPRACKPRWTWRRGWGLPNGSHTASVPQMLPSALAGRRFEALLKERLCSIELAADQTTP